MWLTEEIKSKHKQLSVVEEKLYSLHLLLLKRVKFHTAADCVRYECVKGNKECWQKVLCALERNLNRRVWQMKQTHGKKFQNLVRTQKPMHASKSPQTIDNFVVNLSSTQFSQAELDILNKGLNFAIPPKQAPLAEIINSIENTIQFKDNQLKLAARHGVKQCILRTAANKKQNTNNTKFEDWCTIRKLKTHDVVYTRADKGNSVVIMNKTDYDKEVNNMISTGPYEECKFKNGNPRDPLNAMIDEANNTRQKVAELMNNEKLERKLIVPNPKLASLYCLPKIHKTPMAMRPIASNICTPTEKMAAWLINELKPYPVSHGKNVKNSIDLVQKLDSVEVRRGEILVSFDVTALFPSIPACDALKSFRVHLQRNRIPINQIEAYSSLAKTCMNQNLFTFRGKNYKQTFGLSMGSKLSPLLAEVFMSDLENELEKEKYFPRVWKRYVDDVFAIVKERHLTQTLSMLNSKHPTIKFTVEKELDGKLPFLDLLITRKEDNTLKFGIYRKPTSTVRYITSDSNHFGAQKQAAFHSMVHRLINIPMEEEEFMQEKENIYKAAELNGYDKHFVNKIIRRHQRKRHRADITTLIPEEKIKTERISIPFYPKLTNVLKNVLRRYGFHVVFKSDNTLRNLLSNLKDTIAPDERSGIYKIYCQNCSAVYIGQTRRKLKVRIKEHHNAVEKDKICESSVAAHASSQQHKINWDETKLIKNINKVHQLNAWESMFIINEEQPVMNEDEPPIVSSLFQLIKLKL